MISGLGRRPVLLLALIASAAPGLYVGLVWTAVLAESYLRFSRPWLAPLALMAMTFVAIRLARHGSGWGRGRKLMADGLTSLAVLSSALAATGPELGRPLDRLAIVVVIDRSRSIDLVPNAERRVDTELEVAQESMGDDDLVATVAFAADAATEEPLRTKSRTRSAQRADLGRDGTDIAAGLKRALAEMPADAAARIVLMSDGVPTRGDVMAAAAAAVASDIPIDTVLLEQRQIPDVRVVSLRVTPRANEGETLAMRVVVSSPAATEIELRIKLDGRLIRRSRARLEAGDNVLRIPDPAPGAGLHRYDVEVTSLDHELDESADDNSASAFVRVRGPARALVIDGDPGATAFVATALTEAGFRVDQGAASAVPTDIDGMAGYDLIVLGDVPAHALAPRQLDALASYVRDLGGGLLLTGGDRSMGPGGYARTPVEEVSPVSFDLKHDQRRASLAEVLAIDISGSMAVRVGGHTKLELANEGAARSAALLGPGDHLGVVHVDTAPKWSVPLGPVTDKAAIDAAIRGVGPGGGGILVDVALDEAYAALRRATVNLKHALVFADGADAENITPAVQAGVSAALQDGITTSCVSLGQGPDVPALEEMSKRGGGRFYIVEDAARLPSVFTQETILAARSALVERPFRVAQTASNAVTQGVPFTEAPELDGYVVTVAKPSANVILAGPESDPILAIWSSGVGRAAAFSSDLKDRWGGKWTHWKPAARLVAQIARDIGRREDDRRVRLEADTAGGQLQLSATVVDDDGRMQSFRRLKAVVRGPDGYRRDVSLEAAGAGSYAATVPLERPGAYIAVAMDEVTGDPVATTGAALSAGEEMRPTGSDRALLARIAELTGGRARDTLAGIFRDRGARRFAYKDITMAMAMAAALGLLLSVAARRLAIGGEAAVWLGRAVSRLLPAVKAAARETDRDARATLDALLASKQQGREPESERSPTSEATARAEALRIEPLNATAEPATAASPTQPGDAAWPEVAAATTAEPPPPTAPTSDGSPARSAAEILLERRKKRR